MAGLAWHNFMSAAVGIGIALALARGITYRLQIWQRRRRWAISGSISSRATVYVLIAYLRFRSRCCLSLRESFKTFRHMSK